MKYRKEARWARTLLAAGPGWTGKPSPEARTLAASPHSHALPAGVWHTSDHAAPILARTAPVVVDAVHVATGARFRLASVPDGPILSLSAEDDAARGLIVKAWADPSKWANQQRWRIVPSGSEPGSAA